MTTTTNVDEFDFTGSVGADHAQEVMKQGDFEREIQFLQLDGSAAGKHTGKDRIVLRFVTDSVRRNTNVPMTKFNLAWITVQGHYAPTKEKPPYASEDRKWPAKMGAGCRKDPIFAAKYQGACYICDNIESKPSKRVWALAIERMEVKDDQGNAIGWADKAREVFDTDEKGDLIVIGEKDGKKEYQKKTVPAWVLVSQGWKNFFQPLSGQASYFQKAGGSGLLDADWLITRDGTENNDTSYTPIRIAQQQIPAENPWGVPGGTSYDLSLVLPDGSTLMEAIYGDTMPDLRRILAERVSDDYFGRMFVPGWFPPDFDPEKAKSSGKSNTKSATTGMVMGSSMPSTPATAASEEAPSSALAALKNRVMNSDQPAADAPAEAQPAEAASS